GRVVETGTPAQVLTSGGIYAQMHAAQRQQADEIDLFSEPNASSARLRIAIVSREYPPERTDSATAIQAQAKAEGLARRGYDVTVLTATNGRYRDDEVNGAR